MKHILNNLTEEEKNSIREQHTGGMKVMTENFNKLLNSKLGDSKPLVNEDHLSEQATQPIKDVDKKAIETFLNKIKMDTMSPTHWVLDPNNQNKRGDEVKLSGKENITIPTQFINKPLIWSSVSNGKKIPNVSFQINNVNGKILYTYLGSKTEQTLYKELVLNLGTAISQFNNEVKYT